MKISTFLKPLSFLPALALMYMIYSFSSQPASSSSSTSFKVSRKIIQVVDLVAQKNWDDWEIDQHATQIHGIVRKAAHMTEYFLLAIAVSFPLYVYGVRGILLMILAGLICVGYACADEYHQSLVDGRAASARDVLIDSVGVLFGIILTRLIGWSGRMAITGPMYERRQKQQQKELDAREEELRRREEALRREEIRYRRERSLGRRAPSQEPLYRSQRSANPGKARSDYPQGSSDPGKVRSDYPQGPADPGKVRSDYPQGSPDPRKARSDYPQGPADPGKVRSDYPQGPADPRKARSDYPQGSADPRQARPYPSSGTDDRTRVIGTSHEVDDRTRVYRSEEEQHRMEEAYRKQVYERRRVQSEALQEDSTSDQLSEDLPFSRLFRKKE